jgi:serine/threonine-protein kinase/endoribonuclease IRE1
VGAAAAVTGAESSAVADAAANSNTNSDADANADANTAANPEAPRLTEKVDVFSFGLVLHALLTGGRHPFGDAPHARDARILAGAASLAALAAQPEAANLVAGCLARAPGGRPSAAAAMAHPLWWPAPRRLAFLVDVSDRVEGEDRAEDRSLYAALEALSAEAVPGGSWAAPLDAGLVSNLGEFPGRETEWFRPGCILVHFLFFILFLVPTDSQPPLSRSPPARRRPPPALSAGKYRRYDFASLRDLLRVVRNKHSHFRELPPDLRARLGPLPDGFLEYFAARFPALLRSCFYFALRWCAGEAALAKYFDGPDAAGLLIPSLAPAAVLAPDAGEARAAAPPPPRRPADPNGGAPRAFGGAPERLGAAPVPLARAADGFFYGQYPRRAGAPECEFFLRTGHCGFGAACRFDHPPARAVRLTAAGLPLRPGQPACAHHARTRECGYGPSCRWDHSSEGGGGARGEAAPPPAQRERGERW